MTLESIMVSKYFELKTSREEFKRDTESLIQSLKNAKILIYGAGAAFPELERQYNLKKNLNITAITDRKFNKTKQKEFFGIKAISFGQILKEDFDFILVTNEQSRAIIDFLYTEFGVQQEKIKTFFSEKIKDEVRNINFLYENDFDKTLPKLIKTLKDKKVILYGAGSYLEIIKEYYDLSGLNIIGISDKRYSGQSSEQEFLGYKTIAPENIPTLNPDYVLVTTKFYIRIIEDLHKNLLKGTKIRLKPLVKKSFKNIFKEIRNM